MVRESDWLAETRTVDHLPDAVWMRILALLSPTDRARSHRACRRLRRVGRALQEQGLGGVGGIRVAGLSFFPKKRSIAACASLWCATQVLSRTWCATRARAD